VGNLIKNRQTQAQSSYIVSFHYKAYEYTHNLGNFNPVFSIFCGQGTQLPYSTHHPVDISPLIIPVMMFSTWSFTLSGISVSKL